MPTIVAALAEFRGAGSSPLPAHGTVGPICTTTFENLRGRPNLGSAIKIGEPPRPFIFPSRTQLLSILPCASP